MKVTVYYSVRLPSSAPKLSAVRADSFSSTAFLVFLQSFPLVSLTFHRTCRYVNMSDAPISNAVLLQKLLDAERRVGELQTQLGEKERQIREMLPLLSIRKKIEVYESLYAPELKDPHSVFRHSMFRSTHQTMDFHEAKWKIILTKIQDVRIIRLKGLISAANISEDIFCRTVGSFFLIASVNIHLPELSSYTATEIDTVLRTKFQIRDPLTISCITDVLMHV